MRIQNEDIRTRGRHRGMRSRKDFRSWDRWYASLSLLERAALHLTEAVSDMGAALVSMAAELVSGRRGGVGNGE